MEYTSSEMQNAVNTPSSITQVQTAEVNTKNLKDELKSLVFLKDRKLMNVYDSAFMCRVTNSSGNEVLKNLLYLIRDHYTNKLREDNVKNLTVRKNFDIMFAALELLIINNIDISSDEMNTLILGFLSKSFLV
jgi:DNA-binding FadR family transcriptional regulator